MIGKAKYNNGTIVDKWLIMRKKECGRMENERKLIIVNYNIYVNADGLYSEIKEFNAFENMMTWNGEQVYTDKTSVIRAVES